MVYQVSATPFHVVEPSAGQNLTDGNHSFKHSNVIPLFKGAQGVTHKHSNVFLHLKVFKCETGKLIPQDPTMFKV